MKGKRKKDQKKREREREEEPNRKALQKGNKRVGKKKKKEKKGNSVERLNDVSSKDPTIRKRRRRKEARKFVIGKEGEFLENGVDPGQRGLKRRQ